MKRNSKKIFQYSAMALAVSAVLPISCNKNEEEPDDPEIDVITPNWSINVPSGVYIERDTIVNIGSSTIEMDLGIGEYSGSNIAYLDFDDDSYVQNNEIISVNGDSWNFFRLPAKGTTIETTASLWSDKDEDGYFFVKDNDPAPGASHGINGQGDKYIAFRKEIDPATFKYGWIKVNVSSDAKSISIKEIALSNVNNKVIKVGAK